MKEVAMKYLFKAVAIIMCLVPAAAHAEPTVLRFATFLSDQDVNWRTYLKPFIDAVNADAASELTIEGYPNGALGRAVPQQPQLLLDGVADITFVVPSLSSGRFPDDALFELPGLFQSIDEGTELNRRLMEEGALRGYSDFVVLASMTNVDNFIHSRRKIENLEDLSGLKVRILGPVSAQAAKSLGMVPIQMPPTEVVEALGRGTIDAVFTVPSALFDFGMARVTRHDYHLDVGSNSFAVLMKRDKFEALSPSAQDALVRNGNEFIRDKYVSLIEEFNKELLDQLAADSRRTVVKVSSEDRVTAINVFTKISEEWADKDEYSAELLKKARAILEDMRSSK
ncbi:hypothetical protein G3A39_40955 [Paraburkholderia aspalathi]|nr:hypothetical protein [Paraburkholderia aspalathi]